MSHEKRIAGAATVISAATSLSRVLGYARDAAIAYVFGAGLFADAFFMAFRISNLLRRLVGEGALTSSFVPIFTEEKGLRTVESTRELSSSVFTLFAVILMAVCALGMVFSEEIVRLMAPGFASDPEKFSLTVSLTRLLFPYMVFIGLMAIAMGVLNSYRHFAAPALAPVFFNLAIIASVFAIAPLLVSPVYSIVIGVLVGGVLQLLIQLPYLAKFGMMPTLSFRFSDPAIKKIFILMAPATFGIGIYQLNLFVTMWFSSSLPEGAVSYLYYAGRLMELPLGIFAVSVTTAVLPTLSEQVAKKEWDGVKSSLSFAVRLVNFVTIPATVGLLVLSVPIVDALFRRGEFTSLDAAGTASALYWYALGLVPVAVSRIFISVFYSMKDTATPVWVAFLAFVANAAFCFALVGPMGHDGLALATTISSSVNCVVLFVILKMRLGRFGGREVLISGLKSLAASVVMGLVVYFIVREFGSSVAGSGANVLLVAVSLAAGLAAYIMASMLLGVTELAFLKGFLQKRGKKAA
ncbi:MAG: murein biosynthesis integral membrane protein MurJ [Deltaproteobacteria bacterium]|nr:murein biosynthesis integral membrane protein MurJ [Deltaproteobacteria bacterium]